MISLNSGGWKICLLIVYKSTPFKINVMKNNNLNLSESIFKLVRQMTKKIYTLTLQFLSMNYMKHNWLIDCLWTASDLDNCLTLWHLREFLVLHRLQHREGIFMLTFIIPVTFTYFVWRKNIHSLFQCSRTVAFRMEPIIFVSLTHHFWICLDGDDCASGPCQNGAACGDLYGDFECTCLPGFSGKTCNIGKKD